MLARGLILLGVSHSLISCNSTMEDLAERRSDYDLCRIVITKPSINIHYQASSKELQARGVSCKPYASEIRIGAKLKDLESRIAEAEKRADDLERSKRFECLAGGGTPIGSKCY